MDPPILTPGAPYEHFGSSQAVLGVGRETRVTPAACSCDLVSCLPPRHAGFCALHLCALTPTGALAHAVSFLTKLAPDSLANSCLLRPNLLRYVLLWEAPQSSECVLGVAPAPL